MTAPAATSAAAPPPTAPPRERILAVARELFYRRGIHAVGVDAIAEAAGTNKMTLYRHFASKDELIAACLRENAREKDAAWEVIGAEHPGDPRGRLLAWLQHISDWMVAEAGRGCALANAAVELPDSDHPARRVVKEYKATFLQRLANLAGEAGLHDPEGFAEEAFLLCEGARIASQSLESDEPLTRLGVLLKDVVEQHSRPVRAPRAREDRTR